MNDLPPFTLEPPAPDENEPTVVIPPPPDLSEPFGPAEEQTKAIVVEADTVFAPHPALTADQEAPSPAPASAPRSTLVIRAFKRRPWLVAIVGVVMGLSLLGLLLSFFPGSFFSSSNHSPTGRSARSSTAVPSAMSTPGLTPTVSPPLASPTPALMSVIPLVSKSCRIGSITVTREAENLTAYLTIINTGSVALKSWTLIFFFFGKPAWITYVSNGIFEQIGHRVTISSPAYSTAIAPGSSVHLSFLANWNGNTPFSPSFRLNSLACSSRSN